MTVAVLSSDDPTKLSADALVIGVYDGDGTGGAPVLAAGTGGLDAAFGGRLVETLALLGATGAVGEVTRLATLGTIATPILAAVGLGSAGAVTAETLRRAAASAVRTLAGSRTVALSLPLAVTGAEDGSELPGLRAAAEGAGLGGYRFAGYASRPKPGLREPVRTVQILVADARDRAARAELRRAGVLAESVVRTRDWVNAAPNELRPPAFADQVSAAAVRAGLDVEMLDEKALRRGGYGGILAVGGGSAAPPRLVRLAYRPRGRVTASVALVGKGVTFDTGGLSLKPLAGMWEMKSDMSGAAAVAGVMLAVAALKPKVAVTAYLPMVENMVSGTSYRPGDVITMYSGQRVEVLNTDAEGRLILADAITRACEDEPDYLLETSTLTGGQVTALGKRVTGVMGSEDMFDRVRRAGEATGEPMWPMPLPAEIRKSMDSDVADLLQCSSGLDRAGHMLQGGVFLSEFIPDGLPWAHLDMAGPAYHSAEPTGYLSRGGTGIPVRTLYELLTDIATNG